MAAGQFEFYQLRCFVAVAKELNFRRAAERMNMTQPPLSRQIRLLEHSIGLRLLERSNRHVALTPAGETFLSHAIELLQRAEFAVLSSRQAERGELGTIAMGFVPSAAMEFVPRIVTEVARRLPGVTLTPAEMMSYEIVEALLGGQIDMGLARTTRRHSELEAIRVVKESFVLAVPADHPLATKETPVLSDLDGIDFVAYSVERGGFIQEVHESLFITEGIMPKPVVEVSQTHSVLALVNRGVGVALVPGSSQTMKMDNLAYRRIDLPEQYSSDIYLILGPNRDKPLLTRVRQLVVDELDSFHRDARRPGRAAGTG